MKRNPPLFGAAAGLLRFASAQTLTVNETTIQANASTLAPAVEVVPASLSNSSSELFPFEALQLTENILANLTTLGLSHIELFQFGDGSSNTAKRSNASSCKVFPGDASYPSTPVWDVVNLLLGGALIKTVPIAAPCYHNWPSVESTADCSFITNNWSNNSYMHAEHPTSVMWPLYQGLTCMPTNNTSRNCTLGGYPSYAVNASSAGQIQLAVNLARNANLRLVVKNTGHDFNGKSAGAGALSIWTHNLKEIQFISSYTEGNYAGPAMKLGSGVQAFEMYKAADKYGVTAVGGEGKTVGVAGGYMAGGGHSPLSSHYGMAADQILSLEVVLPDGKFVTANDKSHPDLFWALRGGGGSTFGVVTSVTVRVYPNFPVISVATLSISTAASNLSAEVFWEAMRAYFSNFITFADAGCYKYFFLFNFGGQFLFNVQPFFAPNHTIAQLQTLLAPLLGQWAAIGINVTPTYSTFDNFYQAWDDNFPLESVGLTGLRTGSRLWPRENFVPDTTLFSESWAAIRDSVTDGATLLAFNIAAAPKAGYPDNAVNPAWRKTILHATQGIQSANDASIADRQAVAEKLTTVWQKRWQDLTPGAGAYMSESDIMEPNFQQSFYGSANYERLLKIKDQYDPEGVFYAITAVGSERWAVQDQISWIPTQNGRLCRV